MAYFQIMIGLRGCYMPDNSYIVQCNTRRDLKATIAWEADSRIDAGFVGLSKRNIAWAANHAWQKRNNGAILPYGRERDNLAFSIEIGRATRREYLDYQKECE